MNVLNCICFLFVRIVVPLCVYIPWLLIHTATSKPAPKKNSRATRLNFFREGGFFWKKSYSTGILYYYVYFGVSEKNPGNFAHLTHPHPPNNQPTHPPTSHSMQPHFKSNAVTH